MTAEVHDISVFLQKCTEGDLIGGAVGIRQIVFVFSVGKVSNTRMPFPVGAAISAEPGIYIPGKFGVRIEDVLFLNQNGCENITKSPKELIVL